MATILIADDLPANRKYLVTLLKHQGHRLLEAGDGAEALEIARAEHPDLVITDVLMPVMDGYELARQLRLDSTTSTVPVVFYTAHYGAREARDLAFSLGVTEVLTKPALSADVLRLVGRALSPAEAPAEPTVAIVKPTTFDREHLRLLSGKLSDKADDLRTANARLRALINIGLELASERDPDRLLRSVCEAAVELFGATYVTLGIVDLDQRTVRRVVSHGVESTDWVTAGDPISGLFATVVDDRRAMRGENPAADPTGPQFPARHPEVKTFLAAPVASPGQVYGWFCLVGNEGRAFSDDDQDLVMALAGQIGRIYEGGHFHRVAQQRTEDLEIEILERRQAELALRVERDRAQRYLDTADVILLALDLEGRVTLVNRYACAILGWTAEELVGRDWVGTCLPAPVRGAHRRKFKQLIAGDTSIIENPIVTRSGEERLIEWRNTLLRDGAGQVTGTFSSGTDITERYAAVDALRSAEERMRFALQASGVGIWDMNYTTGQLEWSAILESQYGMAPGSFGGTFEEFVGHIHPDDRNAVISSVSRAVATGTDFSLLHRAVWPDGTVRWLSGTGRILLGAQGEPVRGIGISLDVTGRHTLEEQNRQGQKMEAIGRLAGGVAHDFNNLLTAIGVSCELLLSDLAPDAPQREGIAEIVRAGESGAGLTRQLLAFSRKEVIAPTLLDLNAVVTDTRALLGRLIGEDVEIVMDLTPGRAPVRADRGQLEQVLVNLALNARDAMPTGGRLTIATTMDVPSVVVLTVTDTGTGMTDDVQARLFEPFFTTKDIGKGTGFGLATVHGIVKASGGTIRVFSEPGFGTSFTVQLPMVAAEGAIAESPSPAAQPPAIRSGTGSETVLVVEDADILRELTRRVLTRLGYTVRLAASAMEARQHLEADPAIDVMLTDVILPGESGPELARSLVIQRPGLKVIYMSGYTEDAILQHGVTGPGVAFLEKPFTFESLGLKIREVLDHP